MRDLCVITGGSSGMGLEAAKLLGKTYNIIIAARNEEKLIKAKNELNDLGIECQYHILDMSSKESILDFIKYVKGFGKVKVLLHAAGMSPHMGDYKKIIDANAYGSVILNEEILKIMNGGVIINVSSMSSYLTPSFIIPKRKFWIAFKNLLKFKKKLYRRVAFFPKSVRSGVAYGISKNFLTWFSIAFSIKAGKKKVRVVSVSPGNFNTAMGALEKEEAKKYIKLSALNRIGEPEEIAYLFKVIIDDDNSYLTGVDIKCDGGVYAYNKNKKIIDLI